MTNSRLSKVLNRQGSGDRKPLREAFGSSLLAVAEVADVAKNVACIANVELACYIDERVMEATEDAIKNQARLNELNSQLRASQVNQANQGDNNESSN